MNKYFIIISFCCLLINNNIFSQKKDYYRNNFIASTIRNDTINFKNDKDRIFILVSGLSCSTCLKDCAEKLIEIKSKYNCEYVLILQGSSSSVLANRNQINYYSEIFKNYDYYLFDFDLEYETILDLSKYESKDFPVLLLSPKQSNFFWIINYSEIRVNFIIQTFENI